MLPSQLIRTSHNLYKTIPVQIPAPSELLEMLGDGSTSELHAVVVEPQLGPARSFETRFQHRLSGGVMLRVVQIFP